MATRYWVGGSGTWNLSNTTNWSATSGGAGGASVPGINDDVRIDTSSGTAGNTITIIYAVLNCKSFIYTGYIDFAPAGSSPTLVVGGTFQVNVSPPSGTLNWLDLQLSSTTTANFISVVALGDVDFLGGANYNVASNIQAKVVLLGLGTSSTLNLQGYTISCNNFDSSDVNFIISNGNISVTPQASEIVAKFINTSLVENISLTINDSVYPVTIQLPNTTGSRLSLVFNNVTESCTFSSGYIQNLSCNGNGVKLICTPGSPLIYGNLIINGTVDFTGSTGTLNLSGGTAFLTRTLNLGTNSIFHNININAGTDTIDVSNSASIYQLTLNNVINLTSSVLTIRNFLNVNDNATLNAGTSLIQFNPQSGTTTLYGNSKIFYDVAISSSGTLQLTSVSGNANNTFHNLTCSGNGAILKLKDGSTQTVTNSFQLAGNSNVQRAKLTTINETTAANLVVTGNPVTAVNADIGYSNASGVIFTSYISDGNVKTGPTTGWRFYSGSGFFVFF